MAVVCTRADMLEEGKGGVNLILNPQGLLESCLRSITPPDKYYIHSMLRVYNASLGQRVPSGVFLLRKRDHESHFRWPAPSCPS